MLPLLTWHAVFMCPPLCCTKGSPAWPQIAAHVQDAHRQRIVKWLNDARGNATAFDVTTKGILHAAFERSDLWRLRDAVGNPPGLMGWWPSRAVSFLENHDTVRPLHLFLNLYTSAIFQIHLVFQDGSDAYSPHAALNPLESHVPTHCIIQIATKTMLHDSPISLTMHHSSIPAIGLTIHDM